MKPSDYEPSKATTDDLSTAIGWCVFYAGDGCLLKVFKQGTWARIYSWEDDRSVDTFVGPFTRAKLKAPEPRSGTPLRSWLVRTGRTARFEDDGCHVRWSPDDCMFHEHGDWMDTMAWHIDDGGDNRQAVPADGKPWDATHEVPNE